MRDEQMRADAAVTLAQLDQDLAAGIAGAVVLADRVLVGATTRGAWVVGGPDRVAGYHTRDDEVWHLPTRTPLARWAYAGDAFLGAVMTPGLLRLLAGQWREVAGQAGEAGLAPGELGRVAAQCREFVGNVCRSLGD